MGDQIKGMVERRNRDHRPDRLPKGVGCTACARLGQLHRNLASAAREQFMHAEFDALNGAARFRTGVDKRFSALARNLHCEALCTLVHERARTLQDGNPFVNRNPGLPVFVQRTRLVQPPVDLRPVDQVHAADALLVVRIEDLPGHWGHSIALSSSIRTFRFSE